MPEHSAHVSLRQPQVGCMPAKQGVAAPFETIQGHRRHFRGGVHGAGDPYEALGVTPFASQGEIKAAFRRLAMQYHPDVNPGDPAARGRFAQINAAYERIGDAAKRRDYDSSAGAADHNRYERTAAPTEATGAPPRWQTSADMGAFEAFLKGMQAGAGAGGPKAAHHTSDPFFGDPKPDVSIHVEVRLSFEEAARGCEKELAYRVQRGVLGRAPAAVTRTLTVRVPAGIQAGEVLRIEHKGEPCFVHVVVEEHEVFRRHGIDLHLVFPLAWTQAIRGASVRVPTLEGDASVLIAAGTQHGAQHRLKGKGLPDVNATTVGDLVIHFIVEVPHLLSERQRRAVEEFAADENRPVSDPATLRDLRQKWGVLLSM